MSSRDIADPNNEIDFGVRVLAPNPSCLPSLKVRIWEVDAIHVFAEN